MSSEKKKLPKLGTRAEFIPETLNEEKRTVDLVVTTEKPVMRGFWNRFLEVLDMKPESVRMARMENGAPLLNSHNRWSLDDQLGVVEKSWFDGDKLMATVRFSKAEDDENADKIFRKVKDGIIRNVSVGYAVHRYEKQPAKDPNDQNEIPTYRATDWEPMEVSLVSIPADENAGVRSEEGQRGAGELFDCELIFNERQEDINMSTKTITQENPPVKTQAEIDAEVRAATEAETNRVTEIMSAVKAAGLSNDFAVTLISGKKSVDEARKLIIDEWAKRGAPAQNPVNPEVTITRDERDTKRSAMENVIEHRMDSSVKLIDSARSLHGLTLKELARESLRSANEAISANPMEMVGRAFHSTSDFPLVLANVINKRLRKAYEEAPETWRPLVNETEVSDFKIVSRNQIGDAPALLKVPEGGEFKRGTAGEAAEQYSIATYGRILAVTRQLIINDDLGAIVRLINSYGGAAKALVADLVYNIIINGNSTVLMSDGNPIFHASHGNIATANAAVESGLASMREKLKKQTSIDSRYLTISPAYLLTGVERDDEVEKAQAARFNENSTNDNTFIKKLTHISDPRLGAAPYFLFGSPSQIDTIEVAYLQGTGRSLYTEQRVGFDVDGLEVKARLDVGAKAIDWRGMVRNAGQ